MLTALSYLIFIIYKFATVIPILWIRNVRDGEAK